MKNSFFKKSALLVSSLLISQSVLANEDPLLIGGYKTVTNAKISTLYGQSKGESGGHGVILTEAVDQVCEGRLYIDFADEGVYSMLLSYKLTGETFNVFYKRMENPANINGHIATPCKISSVF